MGKPLWLSSTEDRARSQPGSSKLSRPTASDRIRPGPGAAGGATRGASRACDSRQPTTAHGQLHVCEGEVTALGKGFAIAAGGTSGFQVAACRDPAQRPGRIAARALVHKLRETGREVEADGLYALNDDRIDAADVLAVEVGERASIREHDGGLSEDESLRKAWAASVGRATAREIKTLSQALEAMGKPKFTLGSRPLVLGTGKRNSRGWGGTRAPAAGRLDGYGYSHRSAPIFQKKLLL